MLLGYRGINAIFLGDHRIRNLRYAAADAIPRRSTTRCCLNVSPQNYNAEESMARIKEMFNSKIELSASAYDTAWVAMVPSRDSPNKPCFPQCLNWIMENQHQDGSWGLHPAHPLLLKDHLSCTMACVLALTKWRVGEEFVQRGLEFINGSSQGLVTSNEAHHLISPIGFDIVFPSMMKEAIELGVNLPLDHVLMDRMISNRTSVIERNKGKIGVVGYVGEGLVKESFVWEEMMKKHQRSNGSFFNSPATTAAALIHHHHHDHKCFQYLCSLLKEYKNGVPTVYPMETYGRLCMVDTLERLGVERYFTQEIQTVLNHTHRHWQLKSEEIFLDVNCCAMAFRLLRMHGYEVSSNELERFSNEEQFFESTSMQYTSLVAILELYKASVLLKHLNDHTLEKIHAWTTSYLRQQLLDKKILDGRLCKEVEYALKDINGTVLERIQSRQNIDLYDLDNFEMLKTSYRCSNIVNEDFLTFSIHDFNKCQAILRAEVECMERWYKENRLDQIKDIRNVVRISYFIMAADLFNPQLSEARISFAQLAILVAAFDDLCDKCASEEELINIVNLVKKWDEPPSSSSAGGYCSMLVEIFVSALITTTNEMATKASIKQGRSLKNHIITRWVDVLESMMKESEWWKDEAQPTMDEYLSAACSSIAFKLTLFPVFCSLGMELTEEVLCSKEYDGLTKQVSILCRLQNDLQTYKKEMEERKTNSITLQLCQVDDDHIHGEVITLKEAIEKVKGMVEMSRRELLKMVLHHSKQSQVPKVCKDMFWTTSKIADFLYSCRDEYSSQKELTNYHMNKIIYEPVNLRASQQKNIT